MFVEIYLLKSVLNIWIKIGLVAQQSVKIIGEFAIRLLFQLSNMITYSDSQERIGEIVELMDTLHSNAY